MNDAQSIFSGHSLAVVATTRLLDLVYFSAVVYTTLGLGDLVPGGHPFHDGHGGADRFRAHHVVGIVHLP